jgi:hypothetical protein
MVRGFRALAALAVSAVLISSAAHAETFNGAGDNQTDAHGYYYAVGGGLLPNGQTRNGDNASGGTIRFVTDDPAWGQPTDVWRADDWFPATSSLALTMSNSGSVVFDNNGIETNNVPAGYWNSSQVPGSTTVGYSMSNNFDWIYAGHFHLAADTIIDTITGYFIVSTDPDSPAYSGVAQFDPNDPSISFNANIFSEVAGMLPKNTGSFRGDVFSSNTTGGTFSWSDTGYDRVTSTSSSDIYRLNYKLNAPITLAAGDYYFSHDASIVPLPSVLLAGAPLLGAVATWRRRRRSADAG